MRRRDDKFPDNGFEAWGGYMQAKIAKLEEQFDSRAGNEEIISNIFCGVSIYVNGFTVPSADELKALMPKHGGIYHTYKRSDDYIIASNLPDTKVKNMTLTRVVKPEWITESISANRLLDYRDFLLYKNSRTQPQLNFDKVSKTVNDSRNNSVNSSEVKGCSENETVNKQEISEFSLTKKINSNIITLPSTIDIPSASSDETKKDYNQMAKTAADPNFISEFYSNSRLHHISELGACFKQHINDLRETSNFKFPSRSLLKERIEANKTFNNLSQIKFEKGKVIMHIDMDCFFVSVGLRSKPEMRGKPVAVTHSKGGQPQSKRPGVDRSTEFNLYKQKQNRKISKVTGQIEDDIEFESRVDHITDEDDKYGSMSEIASCSYEARAKGVGNGMFMGAALRLCPDLQTIPYDFEGYKEVAYTLYNTIAQYTLDIEAVSCDEMYVDCTEMLKDMDVSVQDFATAIREEIKVKTNCPCSTGFGGNRLQARLATKRAKPDGQFFLSEDLVQDYMFDIKLKDLPGVGRQTALKLESLGHTYCGTLQLMSLATLKCQLGVKTGAQLYDQCRGRDPNPLNFITVRKSVSAEVNYGIRFENNDQCVEFLKQLATEVSSRMLKFKVLGKCITLKLMVRAEDAPVETAKFMGHGFCNVINKSTTLNNAMNDVEIITKEVVSICKKLNIDPKEMRGVGIQVSKLESITNKETKGAISKFLCHGKQTKMDNKDTVKVNNTSEESSTKRTESIIFNQQNSPKKPKIELSPKKSPIITQNRSPTKRRGRPPKNSKLQTSTSKNLMNKFLQGKNAIDMPYRNPLPNEFPKPILIVKIKQEKHMPQQPEFKHQHGLLGLSWKEVRELLRAWLDNSQAPLPCDVNLITEYMREMVVNKNLENLYILLRFFKRSTHEMGDPEWINVYDNVIGDVQNAMIAVYGKQLLV